MQSPVTATTLRTAAPPLLLGAAGALAVGVVSVVDPGEPGHYPTCPFLAVTGLQCPGCGTLRAVHALAHGDLIAAIDLNVIAVLLLPLLAWAWWRWLLSSLRGRSRAPALPAPAGYAIAATLTVFWFLRNTPWFPALAA